MEKKSWEELRNVRIQQKEKPRSYSDPTPADKVLDTILERFTIRHVQLEDSKERSRKRKVLDEIEKLFNEWVHECYEAKGLADHLTRQIQGRLFSSGSWFLGVFEKDADIDVVCVAPQNCTRDLFFSTFREKIETHPKVENFNAVETARVPIMTFDFDKVNIDLLLAVLPVNSVAASLDINDDAVLDGVEDVSRRSLNGPRDTQLIVKLIKTAGTLSKKEDTDDAKSRYERFVTVVRCIRVWARQRCLYSNKMGYLGGINFNILLTFIIQLYPQASPGRLLYQFFTVLSKWEWPDAVMLNENYSTNGALPYDMEVWTPAARFSQPLMPIITPSYPAYNSSDSVNQWSLEVMKEEFDRAAGILARVNELAQEGGGNGGPKEDMDALLDELVQPSDFFWRPDHEYFLAVSITGSDEAKFKSWSDFAVARVKELLVSRRFRNLGTHPVHRLHLLPKAYSEPLDKEEDQKPYNTCIFIAFVPDKEKYTEDRINASELVGNFRDGQVSVFGEAEGLDIQPFFFKWKDLPDWVFEPLGGRVRAKELRKARKSELKKEKKAKAAPAVDEAVKLEAMELTQSRDEAATQEDLDLPSSCPLPPFFEKVPAVERALFERLAARELSLSAKDTNPIRDGLPEPLLDAGKALELDPEQIDELAGWFSIARRVGSAAPSSTPPQRDMDDMEEEEEEVDEPVEEPLWKRVQAASKDLPSLKRPRSQSPPPADHRTHLRIKKIELLSA